MTASPNDSDEILAGDKTLALIRAEAPTEAWPFIEALLRDPELDVREAERAAGWPKGAGRRCLADSRVRNTIGQIMVDRRARHVHIRDKALITLAQIAFYDPAEAWDERGMKSMADIPKPVRMAIVEYSEIEKANGDVRRTVKFANRAQVLDLLLKQYDILQDQIRQEKARELQEGLQQHGPGQGVTINFHGVQPQVLDATPDLDD